jgi:hypothetical protein
MRVDKEEVVLAEHLVALVAAQFQESGVDVDDRVVDHAGVGDHHRHAGRLDCLDDEEATALFDAGRCAPLRLGRCGYEAAW